jgi:hypothetical protein
VPAHVTPTINQLGAGTEGHRGDRKNCNARYAVSHGDEAEETLREASDAIARLVRMQDRMIISRTSNPA